MSNLGQQIKKYVNNKRSFDEESEKFNSKKNKVEEDEEYSSDDEDETDKDGPLGPDLSDDSSDDEGIIEEMGNISDEEEDGEIVDDDKEEEKVETGETDSSSASGSGGIETEPAVEVPPEKKQISQKKLAEMISLLGERETSRMYNLFADWKRIGSLNIPYPPRHKRERKRYEAVLREVNKYPTDRQLAIRVVTHLRFRGANLMSDEPDCNDDMENVFRELKISPNLRNYFYLYVERLQADVMDKISSNLKAYKKIYSFTTDE